jgi:uncharacterized protein
VSFKAPSVPEGRPLVQRYRVGGFTIGGVTLTGSVLILPDRAVGWAASAMDEVTLDGLAALRTAEPSVDLLLLGTGPAFALAPAALREGLRGWGIVVETMATPAACRTYNLLVAEGRRVAAALLALP